MRKSISIIFGGVLLLFCISLMAENNLNTQVNDLQIKLERIKTINSLTQETTQQQQKISGLTNDLKDSQNALSSVNQELKTANIQIKSLQDINGTLKKLKAQLEEEALNTQKKLTDSYDKKMNEMQQQNKNNLDSLLSKYSNENKNIIAKNIEEKSILIEAYDKKIKELQLNNKEKYDNLYAQYTADKKELQYKLDDLNKEVATSDKQIQDFKDKASAEQAAITALNETISTLKNQKKELEESLSSIQNQTVENYREQIQQLNIENIKRIDAIKKQYSDLAAKNNDELIDAKNRFNADEAVQKQIFKEQLNELINTINSKQNDFTRIANYMAENSDQIGSAAYSLEKAYKNVPNPFPEKNMIGKALVSAGVESENPSWNKINASNNEIRENISSLNKISESLSKEKLNADNLMKQNSTDNSFLGIF